MSLADNSPPEEDKWRLRERLSEIVKPLQAEIPEAQNTKPADIQTGGRFQTRFTPHSPALFKKRSFWQRLRSDVIQFGQWQFKGVNDNGGNTARQTTWKDTVRSVQKWIADQSDLARVQLHHVRYGLKPYLPINFKSVLALVFAAIFFVIPLSVMTIANITLSSQALSIVLISSSLIAAMILGPLFGTVATISSYSWLVLTQFDPLPSANIIASVTEWTLLALGGAGLVLLSFVIGHVATLCQNLFRLGLQSAKREAEIEEFQERLRKARNVDTVLSYIVAFCRDKLHRRVIFLALDEADTQASQPESYDITTQLKTAHYARVIVDRKNYIPRAIMSFKASGYAAYPLETPSGTVALLGIEAGKDLKISGIDDRYVKLLLVTAAYALERIFLYDKLIKLEDYQSDMKARNVALLNIIGNLTDTTNNIDDQIFALKQFLDREPDQPYSTAINFIRRNISALRNSIGLMRDVTN